MYQRPFSWLQKFRQRDEEKGCSSMVIKMAKKGSDDELTFVPESNSGLRGEDRALAEVFRVGLFHFNVDFVKGNKGISDRYCEEVIAPFLGYAAAAGHWRATISIAASGLEYLSQHYDELVRLLRQCVDTGRIELLCSTYTPSLWPAFPALDLLKSVSLAEETLRALKLPRSRVFFAQESFFGAGLGVLRGVFDAVVCKDDGLLTWHPTVAQAPAFRCNGLLTIVGRGHLRNLLAASEEESQDQHTEADEKLIRAKDSLVSAAEHEPGKRWRWYHCGSAHHFTGGYSPYDQDRFFQDSEWMRRVIQVIGAEERGNRFETVGEMANDLAAAQLIETDEVIESSWNAMKSGGIRQWMGRHSRSWQDHSATLGHVWMARGRLIDLERRIATRGGVWRDTRASVDAAWRDLLQAEGSDAFGWDPIPAEAQTARTFSDQVLRRVHLIETAMAQTDCEKGSDRRRHVDSATVSHDQRYLPEEMHWIGCIPAFTIWRTGARVLKIHVVCRVAAAVCGMALDLPQDHIFYCRSSLEHTVSRLGFASMPYDLIYLPLTNGLIGLGNGVFWIRDNRYGLVAATVDRPSRQVQFCVENAQAGTRFECRLWRMEGTQDDALSFANMVNDVTV
jgi:hypothetical protein